MTLCLHFKICPFTLFTFFTFELHKADLHSIWRIFEKSKIKKVFGPFGPDFLEPYKNNFYSLDTFTRNLRACQGESSRYYRSLFHLFAEHKWCGFLPRASPRWCSCGFFGRKNGVNCGATIAKTCPNVCGEKVALIGQYKVASNNFSSTFCWQNSYDGFTGANYLCSSN